MTPLERLYIHWNKPRYYWQCWMVVLFVLFVVTSSLEVV